MPVDSQKTMSDAVRSLSWAAAIERRSAHLPHRRGIPWFRQREFLHDDHLAVAASLDLDGEFPFSGIFQNRRTGASTLLRPDLTRIRSDAVADVVLCGLMRTARQLRFRSFYLSDGTARTLAVHQRRKPTQSTRLVNGVQLQEQVRGRIPFVVPRVIDAGQSRFMARPRQGPHVVADWVVDEALDGSPVPHNAAVATAREMLALFGQSWHMLGVDHAPIDPDDQAAALAAIADLVENPPPEVWPAEMDRDRIRRRAEEILTSTRPLTIGFTHGDPGISNVLRLPDHRLALIDWEHAGYRMVAHDVVKVLISIPNPSPLAADLDTPAELRPALSTAAAMPWRQQAAVALLLYLIPWRRRRARAIEKGALSANIRRTHKLLRTLAALTDG